MMAFTTLFISVPIIILLYFLVFKKVKLPVINYVIVLTVGVLFFFGRSLHLIYLGLEVIIIGVFTVFLRDVFNKKNKATIE